MERQDIKQLEAPTSVPTTPTFTSTTNDLLTETHSSGIVDNNAITDITNGSIAGAIGKTIEYPFDTIKVRLQTQGSKLFPTTWSCIKYTYQNEGIRRGFFQGISSPLCGAALENATLFLSYNQCSKLIENYTQFSPITNILISGGFAGSCASFVLTPVELIKCKLQISNIQNQTIASNLLMKSTSSAKNLKLHNTRIVPTIQTILKTNGISGLWQGQSSTFIRETIGGVVWFATYEIMKKTLKARDPTRTENKTWELLLSGGSAGLLFNASIFPADTIKSVMQTEQLKLKESIFKILATQGIPGFYRGLGITLIRAVPANAAVFYTYETLSKKA
ncbi:hypothetical protein TBLA_0A02630 [Henningerozyma blattae CBS 6284]|uniref:Mitochondrial ornithine carrier protein n=1 Tax=Henningerozyma blattae (strain ATCC 34711 / CBS 6284 / DSM 70876 / NBRC 10599 / NRRL Y-10934 / UCD 77-7) TaxID=1071380 RepID=I2GVB0_HENB6|nr:hypothetical protein TBLA_0A02630 [Tetrapisispora blattae CBS 6284]CCH58062.1 hypothetical protein TBLA_0A02630 [Tetrapisispora blattae CBS 6284]